MGTIKLDEIKCRRELNTCRNAWYLSYTWVYRNRTSRTANRMPNYNRNYTWLVIGIPA